MNSLSKSSDRAIRSLARLEENASTSRALNLVAVWKRLGDTEDYAQRPFFNNAALNRSIIVKHRLRGHEQSLLRERRTGTKVILPIDVNDLRTGARSFFIGERGYEDLLNEIWRSRDTRRDEDLRLLRLLDDLPSLDPFLLRERLRKAGYDPARCYFELSDGDAARMLSFVQGEVAPLIGLSFGAGEQLQHKAAKLAAKVLNNDGDADLEPLRASMGLSRADFEEGVFCWKGFIYYKWSLSAVAQELRPILAELAEIRIVGPRSSDDLNFIATARARMTNALIQACDQVRDTLRVYDTAYAELTQHGKPQVFRDFLLEAPSLFHDLGERLGAVQHVVSFWRFRCPPGKRLRMTADEWVDLLADFQSSLSFEHAAPARVALPL